MSSNMARPSGGDGDARACANPQQLDIEDAVAVAVDRQLAFDYGSLEPSVRAVAVEAATKIKLHGKRAAESIVAIGVELIAAKQALPHGQWLPWLQAEFGWSESSANRFMRVARVLKSESVSVTDLGEIELSALYLLTARSTPKVVREIVAEKAAAGEPVKHEFVKNLVSEGEEQDGRSAASCSAVA